MYKEISQERKQELFDKSIGGVWRQGSFSIGKKSFTLGNSSEKHSWVICKYRDGRGNKCAAGHLIPDELYDESIENVGFSSLRYFDSIEENPLGLSYYEISLVLEFQSLHDYSAELTPFEGPDETDKVAWDDFRNHIIRFAKEHNLNTSFIEQ